MEQAIVDPNRSDRWSYFGMGGFLGVLSLILPFTNPAFPAVGVFALLGGLFMVVIGVFSRPYVVLDPKGVTYRRLLRKKFYPWNEIVQVGIRNTKATKGPVEYLFVLVIVIPGPYRHPLLRDAFQSLLVPNQPEIRKFVAAHYGPLDFDDTDTLNNWEKRYYGLRRKP